MEKKNNILCNISKLVGIQSKEKKLFLSGGCWEIVSGLLCPVWGFPLQGRQWQSGTCLSGKESLKSFGNGSKKILVRSLRCTVKAQEEMYTLRKKSD